MKDFIAAAYGVDVTGFVGLGRGFYSETWRVETESGIYTAKLDLWPTHSREFRDNLDMLVQLDGCGLDFVPGLLRGKNGEKCFEYAEGVLALFDFMEGEHSEDFAAEALFEKLGRVYARCPAPRLTPEQMFTLEQYHRVCRLVERLDSNEPEDSAILQLLEEKRPLMEARAAQLKLFMDRCLRGSYPTVLTHGDAGGNCIINGDKLSIIDWDTAKYSAPERDAWVHMSDEDNIRRIEQGLARGGFEYTLQPDAFGFFANSWFFEYIGNYLQCAVDRVEGRRMEMYEGLLDYFGCWIFSRLELADRLV